jgi:hypothetical protein
MNVMVGDGVVFVAWQDPDRRAIYPVGRLLERSASPRFEFTYIAGLSEAKRAGFSSFLAFPDEQIAYRGDELFPLFQNRLMVESRPDYSEYLSRLGLSNGVTPVTLLLRSGGRRATDRVELFGRPIVDPAKGVLIYEFFIRGVRYADGAEERIRKLSSGDRLFCMDDLQNDQHRNAIALRTEPLCVLGFMPEYLAEDLARFGAQKSDFDVRVLRVNPEPAPVQHRLLCRLEVPQREDFVPFSSPRFKPLAKDATPLPPLASLSAA